MTKPFTPAHVGRFLLLCVLGLAAVIGLFLLLIHARARESIKPSGPSSRLLAPAPGGKNPYLAT